MSRQDDARAQWRARADMRVLDRDIPRVDAPLKTTGRARYTHDVRLPNMVYARLVLAAVPRAEIEELDLEEARGMPGVVLVGADKEIGESLVYLGDDSVIAHVVAETPEQAKDAARAVRFALRSKSPVVTREQALDPDAPDVTGRGNVRAGRGPRDAEKVQSLLEGSAHRVKGTYTLPIQHHVCLETHGCVVDLRDDGATVYASTQVVSGNAGDFAQMLGLEASKVRLVCEHMGGGFGSKFGPGLEGAIACRIAVELKRPVHLMLDRPQEFQMAGNRSGTHAEIEMGCDANGVLTAITGTVDRLGGMGGGSFPGLPYIYECENSSALVRSVHTALDANRAMRAPGHPQGSFVMETALDELAYLSGVGPFEIRKRNVSGEDGEIWRRHLDVVAREIGWEAHPNKTKPGEADRDGFAIGIGFGLATWRAGGFPGAECNVRISNDGSVVSSCAVQDLGTGARTYVAAIPAEELGLAVHDVQPRVGDSSLPPGVGSGGSVTTGSVAPVVKAAAYKARTAFERRLSESVGKEGLTFDWNGGRVRSSDGSLDVSFREACAMLGSTPISETANYQDGQHLTARGRLHGAQAAKVRVDTLTGRVEVLDMVAIQDTGIPLNRLAVRSQINGGMVGSLSYGLLEERVLDPELGLLLTGNLETYKIAGAREIPPMRAIVDDEDERWAVTGMAEATGVPGHSAIGNAIYNACGARLRSVPFTPDRVLQALAQRS
ncbi:MAG: xanthine dehydrogenase family protein molybdopterin-binding subunit [Planctomycetota bacterium]